MTLTNWTKLVVAVVAMVCVSLLIGLASISSGEGLPIITLVIGYILGNGVAARKGDTVEPIIGHRDAGRITADLLGGWALMLGGAAAGIWGICYLFSRW